MFATTVRRAAQEARPPNPAYLRQIIERHPPKKVWPPNFKKLSLQEQFRFEKKYKRRLALASSRPKWVKITKLMQLFGVTSVIIYTVLFMDWKVEGHPLIGIRETFWSLLGYDYEPSSAEPTQKMNPRGPSHVQ